MSHIKHTTYNSDSLANGLWGKVGLELGPDSSALSVGSGHLAPDDTCLGGLRVASRPFLAVEVNN